VIYTMDFMGLARITCVNINGRREFGSTVGQHEKLPHLRFARKATRKHHLEPANVRLAASTFVGDCLPLDVHTQI
jgi:hypothetical protein